MLRKSEVIKLGIQCQLYIVLLMDKKYYCGRDFHWPNQIGGVHVAMTADFGFPQTCIISSKPRDLAGYVCALFAINIQRLCPACPSKNLVDSWSIRNRNTDHLLAFFNQYKLYNLSI
ncbi:hypothetical protein BABINDRAFT_82640 [Babjeviella inositovora NRRL Y-12698]|uniref:Uncharacterized protein n=1 Tax=Babjeviella inositovora NRRL Y-12698 TaxID=984486 RepID=A0A1E3R009_9ASCO|nr:uncharacterized protein BABINDRAFT_82640 [Babjeviella inositovora NRRL Y-12698]ODQ83246.1 hypothetical protein BABINDRAFT_82640 [Babjeviella inositovora NRRL Y-12698]